MAAPPVSGLRRRDLRRLTRRGLLPSDGQRLLLGAALLSGSDAAAAWHEWCDDGCLDRLDPGSRTLLPLVWRNLHASNATAPDELRRAYEETWADNLLLINHARPALTALHAAGVPTLVLKGAALGANHYRDWGVRPMADVDVLVPTERARDAVEVLRDSGWTPGKADPVAAVAVGHSQQFYDGAGGELDLHWHALYWPAPEHDLWEHAVAAEIAEVPTLAACASDQLLHVCVHGSALLPHRQLRWLADAFVVLNDSAQPIDWDQLIGRARARRLTSSLRTALEVLRDVFPGIVPDAALHEISRVPTGLTERWGHWAAMQAPPNPVRAVLMHWDQYTRWKSAAPRGAKPMGLVAYVLRMRELTHVWEVAPYVRARFAEYRGRHAAERRTANTLHTSRTGLFMDCARPRSRRGRS